MLLYFADFCKETLTMRCTLNTSLTWWRHNEVTWCSQSRRYTCLLCFPGSATAVWSLSLNTHTHSSGEYTTFTVRYIAVSLLPSLTIDGVDRDGRCAPRKAAWYEGHVEGSGTIGASFTQVIQVGKKREVDDGERNVPTKWKIFFLKKWVSQSLKRLLWRN